MKRKIFILGLCTAPLFMHAQLTVEKGGSLYLDDNAVLSVQGNIDARDNIEGNGTILLNGTALQTINSNGYAIPGLSIENPAGAELSSSLKIGKQLRLQAGLFKLGQHNLELGSDATATGSASSYIVTDDAGKLIKSVQQNLEGFFLPVGTTAAYAPLLLRSNGNYHAAQVAIGARGKTNPNKPSSSRDYLNDYWTIERKGINGDLTATAFYGKVTGSEENIQPYYWNGIKWISNSSAVDTRHKLLSVEVPEGHGEIYAMRKGDELLPAAASITLLPNPVTNTATLAINSTENKNVIIRVTDNNGVTVLSRTVTLRNGMNQVNLNVSSLAAGHYTVTCGLKNIAAIKMLKQ